jgi:diguanylate cyclase (GGDEF)-like protein
VDGNLYIALINPGITLIFAGAFFLLWKHQPQRSYILQLSAAMACISAGFLLQFLQLPVGLATTKLISNLSMFTGAVLLLSGILGRYGHRPPWLGLAVLTAPLLAAFVWFLYWQPDLTWRIYLINFIFGTVALLLVCEIRTAPGRQLIDNVLLGIFLFWGLQFFPRPLVMSWIEGPYVTYDDFLNSLYWITSTASAALILLMVALTMVTAIALDVMAELKTESLTDPLSQLLNRRGFEQRMAARMADVARGCTPMALIVCDIDHFKSVNDRFGHAGGDRVIERFAACLRAAAEGQHLAGRIGGEEFALLLENADATTARLFAEGVRIAFSHVAVPGIPEGTRLTASFGVAEAAPGEAADSLFRRADKMLYEAKNMGRDCVRVAAAGSTDYSVPAFSPSALPSGSAAVLAGIAV